MVTSQGTFRPWRCIQNVIFRNYITWEKLNPWKEIWIKHLDEHKFWIVFINKSRQILFYINLNLLDIILCNDTRNIIYPIIRYMLKIQTITFHWFYNRTKLFIKNVYFTIFANLFFENINCYRQILSTNKEKYYYLARICLKLD